jgi:hypothetical protein
LPQNAKSLQLTDAYRSRLLALGDRAEREARRRWPTIEQLDGTDWPERTAAELTVAQRQAIRLTAGYLGAFIRSEGGRGTVPAIDSRRYAGLSRDGRPLTDALLSPIIGVRAKLKAGEPPDAALAFGLQRATRTVGFEAVQAARDALQDAVSDDDRLSGWERAVAGTCAACMALSGSSGPRFEVHPSCQCVPQPRISIAQTAKGAAADIRERLSHWKGVPSAEVAGAERTWAKRLEGLLSTDPEAMDVVARAIVNNERSEAFQRLIDTYGGGRDVVLILKRSVAKADDVIGPGLTEFNVAQRIGGTSMLNDATLLRYADEIDGVLRHEFAHDVFNRLSPSLRAGFRSRLDNLPRSTLANRTDRLEFTDYLEAWSREDEAFSEAVRVVFDPDFKPGSYSPEFQELARWMLDNL